MKNLDTKTNIECPRCGGNGKVEHTHVVEGVCFMCYGYGVVSSKRAEDLTEKAIVRKAKKVAKRNATLLEEKESEDLRWSLYHVWQEKRNVAFFNEVSNQPLSKDAKAFLSVLADYIEDDNLTTESEILTLLNTRYFKRHSNKFRFELSKFTKDNFGFVFMNIPNDIDLKSNCSIIRIFENENKK